MDCLGENCLLVFDVWPCVLNRLYEMGEVDTRPRRTPGTVFNEFPRISSFLRVVLGTMVHLPTPLGRIVPYPMSHAKAPLDSTNSMFRIPS